MRDKIEEARQLTAALSALELGSGWIDVSIHGLSREVFDAIEAKRIQHFEENDAHAAFWAKTMSSARRCEITFYTYEPPVTAEVAA